MVECARIRWVKLKFASVKLVVVYQRIEKSWKI